MQTSFMIGVMDTLAHFYGSFILREREVNSRSLNGSRMFGIGFAHVSKLCDDETDLP